MTGRSLFSSRKIKFQLNHGSKGCIISDSSLDQNTYHLASFIILDKNNNISNQS